MEKNTGKKVVTQGKHREFYLGWNVATLKKILLRERKRHTTCCTTNTCCAIPCLGGGSYLIRTLPEYPHPPPHWLDGVSSLLAGWRYPPISQMGVSPPPSQDWMMLPPCQSYGGFPLPHLPRTDTPVKTVPSSFLRNAGGNKTMTQTITQSVDSHARVSCPDTVEEKHCCLQRINGRNNQFIASLTRS